MPNEIYSNLSSINQESNNFNQNNNLTNNEIDSEEPLITYEDYLKKQRELILGDENKQAATIALGHEPSRNELAQYFVDSGQAETFNKKYFHKVIAKKVS